MNKITAIIPVKQNKKPLKGCIESLRKQTVNIEEILVVSDEGKGQTYARIKGAKTAKTNLLLFVDSDILAKETALQEVLNKKLQGYDEVVARMIPIGMTKYSRKIARLASPDITMNKGRLVICGLHFTLIERNLFLKFAEELNLYPGYAGDLILSKILTENGFKLAYTRPSVYHYISFSPLGYLKKRIPCGYALAKIYLNSKTYWRKLIRTFMDTLTCFQDPSRFPYELGTLIGMIKGLR
jgi:glycosyltransferase involved in cell wall biosynthesis